MLRKLFLLALSVLLLVFFYVLALLREDGQARQAEQWVVAKEDMPLLPGARVESSDPRTISLAMGGLVPLPALLSSASVLDESWHGYYARVLHAEGEGISVLGVRPLSAAPLIRRGQPGTLKPAGSLLGFPVMEALDSEYSYQHLVTDDAAYVVIRPLSRALDDGADKLVLFGE